MDLISVFNVSDKSAVSCLGRNVTYSRTSAGTAETSVCDKCYTSVKSLTYNSRSGREHLGHTGTSLRSFIADNYNVTGYDNVIENSIASCLFAVGAAMPLFFRSPMGMYLFAAVAGLGYGVYNAIDQALNVAVLPNPKEAGKDLGILNLANTLSTVIGTAMTSLVVSIVKSSMHVSTTPAVAYAWVFGVAIVIVLAAAALIMRIRNVK